MWAPNFFVSERSVTVSKGKAGEDGYPFHICVLFCCVPVSLVLLWTRACVLAVLKCCVVLLLVDDFPLAGQAPMPWAVEMEALFILSLRRCTLITTQHYTVATTLYPDYHTTLYSHLDNTKH